MQELFEAHYFHYVTHDKYHHYLAEIRLWVSDDALSYVSLVCQQQQWRLVLRSGPFLETRILTLEEARQHLKFAKECANG